MNVGMWWWQCPCSKCITRRNVTKMRYDYRLRRFAHQEWLYKHFGVPHLWRGYLDISPERYDQAFPFCVAFGKTSRWGLEAKALEDAGKPVPVDTTLEEELGTVFYFGPKEIRPMRDLYAFLAPRGSQNPLADLLAQYTLIRNRIERWRKTCCPPELDNGYIGHFKQLSLLTLYRDEISNAAPMLNPGTLWMESHTLYTDTTAQRRKRGHAVYGPTPLSSRRSPELNLACNVLDAKQAGKRVCRKANEKVGQCGKWLDPFPSTNLRRWSQLASRPQYPHCTCPDLGDVIL